MSRVNAWSSDDVVTWLKCLGFADKASPYQENDVDGSIILTLTNEELTEDLGMTNLQARRMLRAIDFTKDIGASGVDRIDEEEKKVEELKKEYELLKRDYYRKNDKIEHYESKIGKLMREKAEKEAPPIVEAIPQAPPPHREEQHHQQNHHNPSSNHSRHRGVGVLGGAAGGAAGGALKGAIAGAILPGMDASDGAAAGAAVGAVGGAGRAFGRNRRFRR